MSENPEIDEAQPVDGELLAEELKEVTKDVPPEVVRKIVKVTTTRISSESWSGPLPPPAVFKQYPREVQKAIVSQATAQMKHRHAIEKTVVTSNAKNSGRGMTFAFWLTISMLGAGTILVALGHSTAGLIAIFGTGGFQGGNYLLQKWREMQQASKRSKKQNDDHLKEQKDDQEATQGTN